MNYSNRKKIALLTTARLNDADPPRRFSLFDRVSQSDSPWKSLCFILLFGLVLHLIALKFSDTTESDAFVRSVQAWDWQKNPQPINSGMWLPLQTYYMGIILSITHEFYYTPVITNIVLSVATAIPLYWFSRREFGPSTGGFVALAWLLYPLAFRNSLMGLSDTPFALFIALALPLLSYARGSKGNPWQAVLAGLMVTIAAATRYEAWVLIPLLGVTLWRKPRYLAYFGATALVVPGFWMLGSLFDYGDPLYSFTYQAIDTAKTLQDRGGMSGSKRLVRLLFMPGILVVGLSVLTVGWASLGAVKAVRFRRPQAIWLVPFFGLFLILMNKSIAGTMNLQPRYGLILGLFLLPFAGLALAEIAHPKRRSILTGVTLLLMLPSSYALSLLQPVLSSLLSDTKMVKKESPARLMEAIPRLHPSTKALSEAVNGAIKTDRDGLIVMGMGEISGLVIYRTGINPDRHYESIYGHLPNYEKRYKFYRFITDYPEGVLVVDPQNWPIAIMTHPEGGRSPLADHRTLEMTPIYQDGIGQMYRYRLLGLRSAATTRH